MKNRKTILVWMLVIVLMLTACGSSAGTAQPTQAPQATAVQPTKPPAPTAAAATQASAPKPTQSDQAQVSPTGYPAPVEVVPPNNQAGYPAPGTFSLALADGSIKSLAAEMLNSLAKEKMVLDGTELEVLALVDVLKQSKVESYNKITAYGSSNSYLTLTRDQIAQSYLEVLPDGKIRLAVQGLPQNVWLPGLAIIRIE